MATESPPLSPRRALKNGKYVVVDQIGHGAFSTVWRAKETATGALVAIKEIRNLYDKGILKRLLREIRLLKHFKNHPYIVQILDAFTQSPRDSFEELFIVCELMDLDLHKLITSSTPLDKNHIKLFMYQIFLGLKCMHSAQVLHRDLKPKNILVNRRSGELKICDLGMGRTGASDTGRSQLRMTVLTEVATPFYRAPDGILNLAPRPRVKRSTPSVSSSSSKRSDRLPSSELMISDDGSESSSAADPSPTSSDSNAPSASYTSAVDMWACGCILAELVLRKPIFPGKTNKDLLELTVQALGSPSTELMTRVPDGGYKRILQTASALPSHPLHSMFSPSVDSNLLDLITKLLQFDPEQRISVDEALNHPFLEELHDSEEEESMIAESFLFPEDDEEKDLRDARTYRDLLWQEVVSFGIIRDSTEKPQS